jgi:hypothetical protein
MFQNHYAVCKIPNLYKYAAHSTIPEISLSILIEWTVLPLEFVAVREYESMFH